MAPGSSFHPPAAPSPRTARHTCSTGCWSGRGSPRSGSTTSGTHLHHTAQTVWASRQRLGCWDISSLELPPDTYVHVTAAAREQTEKTREEFFQLRYKRQKSALRRTKTRKWKYHCPAWFVLSGSRFRPTVNFTKSHNFPRNY